MQTDVLYDLARFFEDERELYVVAALHLSGAMRFNEVAYTVSQCARTKIPDSTIARVLARLSTRGIVTASRHHGRGAYRLTEQGQRRGALIEALALTLADSKPSIERPSSAAGCAAGGGRVVGTI